MLKIFVNLTCINQTSVYSEHMNWSLYFMRQASVLTQVVVSKLKNQTFNIEYQLYMFKLERQDTDTLHVFNTTMWLW